MELTLGLSLAHEPRTVSEFLREVSATPDRDEKMSKIDKYVKNLTDEMRKIDPFKRELPLCVLLLNDAIERLKAEQLQCQKSEDRPVIEEFFPLKRNCEGDEDRDCCEREKWMSSAEPWINNSARDQKPMSVEEDHSAKERNPIQPRNYRNGGRGLFVPFWGQSCVRGAPLEKDNDRLRVSEFTLLSPTSELPSSGTTTKNLAAYRSSNLTEQMKLQKKPQKQLQQQQQQQALRKQRRCWSPELHRRFVEALEQLGGSQVATPKQIRELMDVEGLTNDEVKSHLQKYRLHIRRVPSPSAAHEDGLSLSRETGMDCSKLKGTKSESPQGPLLGTGGSAKGASSAGCESMEMTDEEDNSEAHSWITGLGERVTAP